MTGSAKQSRAACENREAVLDCFVASLLAMTRTGCPMPRQRNQASRQRKLRDAEFTARYKMEKILQRRRYCAVFELWRRCARPALPPSARLHGRLRCLSQTCASRSAAHRAMAGAARNSRGNTQKSRCAGARGATMHAARPLHRECRPGGRRIFCEIRTQGAACATMKFSRQRQRMRVVPALFGYRGAAASR